MHLAHLEDLSPLALPYPKYPVDQLFQMKLFPTLTISSSVAL
jgi:hypothetical protein